MKKMKKQYKIKDSKVLLNYLLTSCIIFSICLLSVGYASITSTTLDLEVSVSSNKYMEIFISGVKLASNIGADLGKSKIVSYKNTMLHSDIYLSTTDSNSSITYTVTIYNNSDAAKEFMGVSFLEENYSNKAIDFKLDGLAKGDHIHKGEQVTFNITFYYKDTTDLTNNRLNSYLNFDFDYYFDEAGDVDVIINEDGSYNFAGVTPDNPENLNNIANINFKVVNGNKKNMIGLQVDVKYSNSTGSKKQTAKIDIFNKDGVVIGSETLQFLGQVTNEIISAKFEGLSIPMGGTVTVSFDKATVTNGAISITGVTLTPIYE